MLLVILFQEFFVLLCNFNNFLTKNTMRFSIFDLSFYLLVIKVMHSVSQVM